MTFSMVARCPKTHALGVCVSTASPAVGSRVPHLEAGVGAIATQANTNIQYGIQGLKLLRMGYSPEEALQIMLRRDPGRETRQAIIIDSQGRTAAFTGRQTLDWKGHLIGENYVAAGNLLVGGGVIEAMSRTFERAGGCLAERLMSALEAGEEAGGDRRGRLSAALFVADPTMSPPLLRLRVDVHREPVRELRRMLRRALGR